MSRLIRLLPRLSLEGAEMACGRQEDAHEFLSHLTRAAEEDGRGAPEVSSEQGLQAGNEQHPHSPNGYMHALFDGSLCSQVRCRQCGNVSSTAEAIQGLELEVSHAGTLQAALEGYCRTEQLGRDTDNAYDCPVCKAHTAAEKSLSIKKAPRLLHIQFKRFVQDPDGRGGSQKVKHVVEFPECLDLSPYLLETSESCATAGNSQYRLSAVVVHLGQGLHSGHYTAYVHPTSSTGVTTPWFLVNDDVVRRVTWQEVLCQPAYMLLYERVEPDSGTLTPTATSAMSRQFVSPKRVEKRSLSFNVVSNGSGSSSLSGRLARDLPASSIQQEEQRAQSRHAPADRSAAYQQHSAQQARTSERDSRFGFNPLFVPASASRLHSAASFSSAGGIDESQTGSARYHAEIQQRAARTFPARQQGADSLFPTGTATIAAGVSSASDEAAGHTSKKARISYLFPQGLGLSRKRLFNAINALSGSKRRRDVGELGHHLSSPSTATPVRTHTRFSPGGADAGDGRERDAAFFEHQQFEDFIAAASAGQSGVGDFDENDGGSGSDDNDDTEETDDIGFGEMGWPQDTPTPWDRPGSDSGSGQEEPKRRRLSDVPAVLSGAVEVASSAARQRDLPRHENGKHVSAAEFREGEQKKKAGSWFSSFSGKIKAFFG